MKKELFFPKQGYYPPKVTLLSVSPHSGMLLSASGIQELEEESDPFTWE